MSGAGHELKKLSSLSATREFAFAIAEKFNAEKSPRLLILLDGPMGAGKTQFTRFLLEAMGSNETASPSFAIHHSYETSHRGEVQHFDLYRVESADDLESSGFWDMFSSQTGVVIVEWSSKLAEFGVQNGLPHSWPLLALDFSVGEGEIRNVEMKTKL